MNANYAEPHAQSVFLDDTAFAAFMNPAHPAYPKARSLFLELDDLERHFVTTNYIVFDVHEWLRNEFGYAQADYFLKTIDEAAKRGKIEVIPGSPELEVESRAFLFERPDLQYSLSEALTAVVLLSYRIGRIFSFNPHFMSLQKMNIDIKIIPSTR